MQQVLFLDGLVIETVIIDTLSKANILADKQSLSNGGQLQML